MNTKLPVLAAVAASTILSTGTAAAQAAAPEQAHWETVANAGLTVQSGNSESVSTVVGLDSKKKWADDEVLLGISGGYGKSSSTGNNRTRTTDYAKAYGQDQEFYAFYRSLRAYRESFANKTDVMVLDPSSDFFRYLNDPQGKK